MDSKSARKKHDKCDTCGNVDKLKKCGSCGLAWYCSRDCQAAAWSAHKKDCKLWQQEAKQQQQETDQQQHQQLVAAAATEDSSGSSGSSGISAAAAAAGAHGASSSSSNDTRRRRPHPAAAAAASRSAAAAAADAAGDDDDGFVLPFKYRTNADPSKKDLESPLHFTAAELSALAEVYPGLQYEGGECSINLDKYLMKKIKTWHVQYLYRKQMSPPRGSREDHIPFFQGLMNKEILIVSGKLSEELGMGPVPIRSHCIDQGVAGAMSVMLAHGKRGIAKHPPGMPKVMIYEPEEYCDIRLV